MVAATKTDSGRVYGYGNKQNLNFTLTGNGQVVYMMMQMASSSKTYPNQTNCTTPGNFTFVAGGNVGITTNAYANTVWVWRSGVFNVGALAGSSQITFGASTNSGSWADWVVTAITLEGIDALPIKSVNANFDYNTSVTVPAVAGMAADDIALAFYGGASVLSSSPPGTQTTAWQDEPAYYTSARGPYRQPINAIALYNGSKPRNIQSSFTNIGVSGQIILKGNRYTTGHPGAPLTGLGKITVRRGIKYLIIQKTHAGGQITGQAKLAGRGVKKISEQRKHYGTLTGIGSIGPGRGLYRRKPPHFRTAKTVSAPAANLISLQIPETVRYTDLLMIEVVWGSSGAVATPPGWTRADGGAVDDTGNHAAFTRPAGRADAGTFVTLVIGGPATAIAGVLAVYTPARIDAQIVTVQSASSVRVVFGPNVEDPGTLRVALIAGRATATDGSQIAFTSPLTLVDGATAATLRAQAENDTGHSIGAAIAEYKGGTSLRGQLTAVVPVAARAWVADLEGVEYHEGHLAGGAYLNGYGAKNGTAGPNQRAPLIGYDGGSGRGNGAHSDIRARGHIRRWNGYAAIYLGHGIVYDTYHGGMIHMRAVLKAGGHGDHRNGYGGRITGGARIRILRGSQLAHGAGNTIIGYPQITGSGHRIWRHPGAPIIGYAQIAATGRTAVNVIKAFFAEQPADHRGDHQSAGATISADGVLTVHRGSAQAYIDERYTQIQGWFTGRGRGHEGPRVPEGQGRIDAIGLISSIRTPIGEPEELDLLISVGQPRLSDDRPVDVEDFELEIEPHNPIVAVRH